MLELVKDVPPDIPDGGLGHIAGKYRSQVAADDFHHRGDKYRAQDVDDHSDLFPDEDVVHEVFAEPRRYGAHGR